MGGGYYQISGPNGCGLRDSFFQAGHLRAHEEAVIDRDKEAAGGLVRDRLDRDRGGRQRPVDSSRAIMRRRPLHPVVHSHRWSDVTPRDAKTADRLGSVKVGHMIQVDIVLNNAVLGLARDPWDTVIRDPAGAHLSQLGKHEIAIEDGFRQVVALVTAFPLHPHVLEGQPAAITDGL